MGPCLQFQWHIRSYVPHPQSGNRSAWCSVPDFWKCQDRTSIRAQALGRTKIGLFVITLTFRLLLTSLRAALAVLLLSNVNFQSTYREIQDYPLEQAGLTSMNTSLLQDPGFKYFATSDFWWHFPSMMAYNRPVTPLRCSGESCQAFYFPGPLSAMRFRPELSMTDADFPAGTTFIQKNAPGYQIEFSPIDEKTDPPIDPTSDCQIFGIPVVAVRLCLKENNDFSYSAGISKYDVY
jgi:hypothetical protein